MKLRALASSARGGDVRFGQLYLSGMVINVPTDLARIQVQLPRKFSVDDTVTVNLKRKLCTEDLRRDAGSRYLLRSYLKPGSVQPTNTGFWDLRGPPCKRFYLGGPTVQRVPAAEPEQL
jgi:hypothetical protein